MMDLLFNICLALSIGLVIGVVFGGIKAIIYRKKCKTYSQQAIASTQKLLAAIGAFLKYFTFLLLVVGFVWCIYFLALGIMQPEQADYANNMSELIVAVLTVISILFAFIEFINRKNDRR